MADFKITLLISRFVTVSIDDVDTDSLGLKSRIKTGEFDDEINRQIDAQMHPQFDFEVAECEKF